MIYPMAAMVLLIFIVGFCVIRARIRAVRSKALSIKYFKLMGGEAAPDDVVKSTRCFNNLFEVPTLFFAAGVAALVTGATGSAMLLFAWLFVVSRAVQAFVHLTDNNVRARALSYFSSLISVAVMWVLLVAHVS